MFGDGPAGARGGDRTDMNDGVDVDVRQPGLAEHMVRATADVKIDPLRTRVGFVSGPQTGILGRVRVGDMHQGVRFTVLTQI